MLLQSNFYSIISLTRTEQDLNAEICINPEHKIFEGHFPDQPVVPGVCMIQIIKELTEHILNSSVRLQTAVQVKFLQLLIPAKEETVKVQIALKPGNTDQHYVVNASLLQNEKAIMKLSARFATVG